MDSAKDQKKTVERLARVRENQRKSRARKQEHRAPTGNAKVEAENRHLKALLGSLGVSTASVQQYLQEADTGANTNRKVAIPAIQRVEEDNALPLPCRDTRRSNLSMAVPRVYKKDSETAEPPVAVNNTCASTVVQPTDQPPKQSPQEEDPALCGCQSDRQDPETVSDEDVLNSTLCAIAEEMINQYNTKGIDVDEIRRKIWSGFRAGANGTGCRVQNHILFQVLDDISSDV
ncbi:hypothetical protein N7516_004387 [Penicillium verrucosum]|uniref:uncharacterized protein n=1 Tax=Penicillium verrucosum TaxID=60171 RepID=UPI002544FF11|nr:uncharacterized protein N7516_004387 [Penicillium verrucosum]KAJ5944219.1 hypothetical protein N7516_004387 [Penicillium verrucosum]